MKKIKIYALIAFLALSGSSLLAQPNASKERSGLIHVKGLTQDQKQKIQSIYLEHAREAMILRNKISEKNAALNTELSQANADRKKMDRTLDELYDLKLAQEKSRMKARMDVRDQLDDQQKLQFDLRRQREGLTRGDRRDGRQMWRPGVNPRHNMDFRKFHKRDSTQN